MISCLLYNGFSSPWYHTNKEWWLLKRYAILFISGAHTATRELLPDLQQHYAVELVTTRKAAMAYLAQQAPDLVLIDLNCIRFKIERFCDELRDQCAYTSLFFLINKGMRLDQLPLASGHLRQPFTKRQLLNRLGRILPETTGGDAIEWNGLRLNKGSHLLTWDTEETPLTPKQAALLQAFLEKRDEILSRAYLMQEVWGTDFMGDTRTLDVHIHWLRHTLKKLQAPFALETQRGKGYRLVANPTCRRSANGAPNQ